MSGIEDVREREKVCEICISLHNVKRTTFCLRNITSAKPNVTVCESNGFQQVFLHTIYVQGDPRTNTIMHAAGKLCHVVNVFLYVVGFLLVGYDGKFYYKTYTIATSCTAV